MRKKADRVVLPFAIGYLITSNQDTLDSFVMSIHPVAIKYGSSILRLFAIVILLCFYFYLNVKRNIHSHFVKKKDIM